MYTDIAINGIGGICEDGDECKSQMVCLVNLIRRDSIVEIFQRYDMNEH